MKHKIYVTKTFVEVVKAYGKQTVFARQIKVSDDTVSRALDGKPVQAGFIAAVLGTLTSARFESLFKVM